MGEKIEKKVTREMLEQFIDFNSQPPRLTIPMTEISKILNCSHWTVRVALKRELGYKADFYGRLWSVEKKERTRRKRRRGRGHARAAD